MGIICLMTAFDTFKRNHLNIPCCEDCVLEDTAEAVAGLEPL